MTYFKWNEIKNDSILKIMDLSEAKQKLLIK